MVVALRRPGASPVPGDHPAGPLEDGRVTTPWGLAPTSPIMLGVMAARPDLQAQLDEQRQRVDVDHFDIPVRELVRMVSEGELKTAPAYQRQFRWDVNRESELVESVLLGLPVPPLFVATDKDGTWELVDGLQRVSTLVHFIYSDPDAAQGIKKENPLQLEGLTKLTAFEGMTFSDLPLPMQLAFNKRPLRVTALSDKSQLDVRFDLFERLNRGGILLTAQEVRACIFRGPFINLLDELANNATFKRLLKLQRGNQDDGTREEQVLKFFAYLERADKFEGRVAEFLNTYMEEVGSASNLEGRRKLFEQTVEALDQVFDGKPVLRKGYGNTPQVMFEALMVAAGQLIQSGRPLKTEPIDVNDDVLVRNTTKGTNTKAALTRRVERASELLAA